MIRVRLLLVTVLVVVAAATAFVVATGGGPFGVQLVLGRQRAARFYHAHAWHDAAAAFQSLIQDATSARRSDAVPLLSYGLGTADYRLGRFDRAVQAYHDAVAGDRALQQRAYYNMGNAYVWKARAEYDHTGKRMALRGAIDSYEEALLIDPTDANARWNLEVALRRLADASDSSTMSRHREGADWGGGNLTKSGYAGAPQTGAGASPGGGFGRDGGGEAVPEITETHARQLLDAVERAQVSGQDLNKTTRRNPTRPSHESDW
jgi:tetratricopeptide (TPR) repeat protein